MYNIAIDSRDVKPGDLFISITCKNFLNHIKEAMERGASIIFVEESVSKEVQECFGANDKICYAGDIRSFSSYLYRSKYPFQPQNVVAITGTNGKSSSSIFLEYIWGCCGYKSASIGTIGISLGGNIMKSEPRNTTPGQNKMYKILDKMYRDGVDHVVFEASSCSISQKRFKYVDLCAAGITNITLDHIYYHNNSFDEYVDAKLQLIDFLSDDQYFISFADDDFLFEKVKKKHKKIISFGIESNLCDIHASNVDVDCDYLSFDLRIFDKTRKVSVKFQPYYQVKNIMCAVGFAVTSGCNVDDVFEYLGTLPHVPGRGDLVARYNGGNIYVDFAHNGDGLTKALESFRKICRGRLICIFGVSDKDYKSRCDMMARAASSLADFSIITDDNISNESKRDTIESMIVNSFSGDSFNVIHDRRLAIEHGIKMIKPNDILLIAGRGPETRLYIGEDFVDFDDAIVVREILASLRN